MRGVIAAVLLLVSLAAQSADNRRYAVLSLAGDKLTIVQREMSTGSRLDRNTHSVIEVRDSSVDRSVLLAIDDALRRAGSSPAILLAARDPKLYAAAAREVEAKDGTARVFQAVRPVLAGTPATHLILVTKHRHRAMLRLRDGHVGSGYLEGLGFYIDHGSLARTVDTSEAERGFIAPYGYLKISLIEIATGKVLAEERVIGSEAVTAGNVANIGNAWNALSEQEKLRRLDEVIRAETSRVVPTIVAQR